MKPVRILLADDHEFVRQGMRTVLEGQPGWVVCGEARTGREAVAKAQELGPSIVVMDIGMPELNGLEAARQLRKVSSARIIILTVHESDQVVADVLQAGAHGYVLKADAGSTLVEAIRAVLRQKTFFAKRVHGIAGLGPGRYAGPLTHQSAPVLSPREREVLQLLTEGKSNKEVAAALGVTIRTAETHRANIMTKLDLHSMSDLVRYAVRNRIIEA